MDGKNSDDGERFDTLIAQLPAAIWCTDHELRFTSVIGGALDSLGLTPARVVGIRLHDFLGTEDEQHVAIKAHRDALAGQARKYEIMWVDRWYETYVQPLRAAGGVITGALGMAIDMTARRRAADEQSQREQGLRRQHKLEAIGQLASGLAHEINNPLQSIINFAQLIQSRSKDEVVREYADGISHEVQSLASIVRNLRCLVHQKADLPVELRLHEIVGGTVSLFAAWMRKEGIRLELNVPADLRAAWGNAYGVQQVLINLLMAARDGLARLPPNDPLPKRIAISTAVIEREGRPLLRLTVEHRHPRPSSRTPAGDDSSAVHELGIAISHEIAHFNAGELLVEALSDQQRAYHLVLPLASEQ